MGGSFRRASRKAKAAPCIVMPCLFHSNSQGFWLGARGKHTALEEHATAQGLEVASVAWPRGTIAFALLGNSVARCILQRLVHRAPLFLGRLHGPRPLADGRISPVEG